MRFRPCPMDRRRVKRLAFWIVSTEHVEARPGAYADSVTLMQASADVRKADGVEAALIAMATELNLGLLADMGFDPPPQAGPNDLLIAVRASDDAALAA